jgi:UDP-N-acetylglucosamine diphosphorylase/glucosamine-1-phosphate N-acetyltransferase
MRICLFEDAGSASLEPLALTHPVFDLRTGARTLLERQRDYFGADEIGAIVRPILADLCRLEHPEMAVNERDWLKPGDVLVNARWLPPAGRWAPGPGVGVIQEQIAHIVLGPGEGKDVSQADLPWRLEEWKQQGPAHPAGGQLIAYPWDLLAQQHEAMNQDLQWWMEKRPEAVRPAAALVGPAERALMDPSARVEPHVLIDTTRGPVLIDREAVIQAFTRLEGPCYVGPGSQLLAARLRGGSLGPECRVGGEVEASILHGFTNKYHDGFLGHSYLGAWVNLGAGTQVSDLRNDYGPITMTIAGRPVATEQTKLGAFLGDHTRTSIGTLLNTGTVAGPFCQLLTSGSLLPRVLPAFARLNHGRVEERNDLSQLLATSAVVMSRRGQEWTETHAELLFALYEQTAPERRQMIRESEQHRMRRVV